MLTGSTAVGGKKQISKVVEGRFLPRRVKSLCPECRKVVEALLDREQNDVFMSKTCPVHGEYKELISTDAEFYELILSRDNAVRGQKSVCEKSGCPNSCGLCPEHRCSAVMVNIDLTNRCNLRCPICFANAGVTGKVVEPSLEQIKFMIEAAIKKSTVEPSCLQFGGGEPTIHPQYIEALKAARNKGFAQIQTASNGIRFANEPDLAMAASEAGLNVVYLQFDGVSDEVFIKTRGVPLSEIKFRAVENLFKAGIRTVLVPTLTRDINCDQIGPILNYAVDNVEKIAGISWQPVSFTGRIDHAERLRRRFTLSDLARELDRQSGGAINMYRDWVPFGFVDPFARFLDAVTGQTHVKMNCSPTCGLVTYVIVEAGTKRMVPIPAFVDIEALMQALIAARKRLGSVKLFKRFRFLQELKNMKIYFHQDRAPAGWTVETLLNFMTDFADFRIQYSDNATRMKTLSRNNYRALLLTAMHFQDLYNFQLDRVQNCVVHYAAADGKLYPFCTYNCGPCHRERVEREFTAHTTDLPETQ